MPGHGSQIQHSKVEGPGEGEAGQGPFVLLVINQPSQAQPEADEPRKHLGHRAASDDLILALRGWHCGDGAAPPKLSHSLAGCLA